MKKTAAHPKTSLILDPKMQRILEPRTYPKGRSDVIRSMIERYEVFCNESRPSLSDAEWQRIALRYSGANYPAWAMSSFLNGFRDMIKDDPIDQKIYKKLKKMSTSQLIAVVDKIEIMRRGEK